MVWALFRALTSPVLRVSNEEGNKEGKRCKEVSGAAKNVVQ
jgi:hypothetical protein